jgi:hypothetical protein
MDFFGKIMGWDSLYPGENTIAWFESKGITSEWDIAPLYIAWIVETVLELHPELPIPPDLLSFCEMTKKAKIPRPEKKVEEIIGQLPNLKKSGFTYCDLLLFLIETGPARLIFSRLAGTPLINTILQYSRNVHQNIITRVFQEVYLGQRTFEDTFHLSAICFDQFTQHIVDYQLLKPEWNTKLKRLNKTGIVEMAIMTARPSAHDYPAGDGRIEFSPEADIVVEQLEWNRIPMIGLGQLQYAADQLGYTSVDLIKPSPVHALGAIGTALSMNLLESIEAGWNLINNEPTTFYDSFPELDIHVFEDSPTGIIGTKKAVDLLDMQGISVNLTKWGISSNPNKLKELENLGAHIVSSVNEALDKIEVLN